MQGFSEPMTDNINTSEMDHKRLGDIYTIGVCRCDQCKKAFDDENQSVYIYHRTFNHLTYCADCFRKLQTAQNL